MTTAEQAAGLDALPAKAARAQRRLAWIVDDDAAVQHLIERAMEAAGLDAIAFQDGECVLHALDSTQRPPDVISVDVTMPGISGLALLNIIRGRSAFADVPIIVCTGRADVRDAVVAATVRAAFVMKPFRMREYVDVVGRMIARGGDADQLSSALPRRR